MIRNKPATGSLSIEIQVESDGPQRPFRDLESAVECLQQTGAAMLNHIHPHKEGCTYIFSYAIEAKDILEELDLWQLRDLGTITVTRVTHSTLPASRRALGKDALCLPAMAKHYD